MKTKTTVFDVAKYFFGKYEEETLGIFTKKTHNEQLLSSTFYRLIFDCQVLHLLWDKE